LKCIVQDFQRAAKIADEQQSENKFETYFSKSRQKLKSNQESKEDDSDATSQEVKDKDIHEKIIKFLENLKEDADWNSISEDFKNEAKKIWHDWANAAANNEHPVEEQIEKCNFLNKLT